MVLMVVGCIDTFENGKNLSFFETLTVGIKLLLFGFFPS